MSSVEFKILAQEDDCAPDRRKYFDAKMKEITGMDVYEFLNARDSFEISLNGGFDNDCVNKNYVLCISADHPYYTLYELDPSMKSKLTEILNTLIDTIKKL